MADLDLARRLVAHPKCPPGLRLVAGANDRGGIADGVLFVRRPNGVRMVDAAPRYAADYEWLPDLADHGTAGVLLGVLGDRLHSVYQTMCGGGTVWAVRWWGDDDRVHATPYADTLGEAAARAVLALWDALDAQGGDRG